MSLAVFHIQNELPPNENSISKHMGMLFLKKNLRETTREGVVWKKASPRKDVGSMFFSLTSLADPPNGHQILKTSLADPLIGRLILKTTLADPPIGHLFQKTTLADPPIGHLFQKTTLADPLIGHLFRKTSLADGSEAGFSRKTTKIILTFRLRFIPARHAIKSRLPGNAFHNSLPLYKRSIGV